MFHEVMNSALAATQVKKQVGTHDPPTQSDAPAHGGVRIRHIQHFLLDQICQFAV